MCSSISKTVATNCHLLRLKCIKFDFGWGSVPGPTGRAYSAPLDPLLRGGRGRKEKGKDGENRYKGEGKGKRRKGKERGARRGKGKGEKVCSRNFQLF